MADLTPNVGLMRAAVLQRDGGCVAPRLDPDAGPCYDRWGQRADRLPLGQLEIDYVRLGAIAPHHHHERDHVALCPGHHRGAGPHAGRMWGPAHRREERAYLSSLEARDGNRG